MPVQNAEWACINDESKYYIGNSILVRRQLKEVHWMLKKLSLGDIPYI